MRTHRWCTLDDRLRWNEVADSFIYVFRHVAPSPISIRAHALYEYETQHHDASQTPPHFGRDAVVFPVAVTAGGRPRFVPGGWETALPWA